MLDSILDTLVKTYQTETLLHLNIYFHFGYSHHPSSFSRADLGRLVSSSASRKATILLHSINLGDPVAELQGIFLSSGVRDLFRADHLKIVLQTLVSPAAPFLPALPSHMQTPGSPDSKSSAQFDLRALKRSLTDKLTADPQFLQLVTVYFE